jgi:thymidine phosphorylase
MVFQPQAVLRRKRDGLVLDEADIRRFVEGVTDGSVGPAQTGAFTMATYLNGMTTPEIVALVRAMRDSGTVVDWSAAGIDPATVVEKHSSGGVGDEKITLLVVPIIAEAGLRLPNMSAWGLDYCPGEIDMLDAVPGYDGAPTVADFVDVVARTGGAIIGPNPDLAPADAKIFRVRDVTATVESVALISGSIMSKKLAANPSCLVMSVGCGSGAFMHTIERAQELATTMRDVATGAGVPSVLLITDLDSVLGTSVGSAVEMLEVADFLSGAERERRTLELVLEICGELLALAGVSADVPAGRALALDILESGRAAARFDAILEAQGGPAGFVAGARDILPAAAVIAPVHAAIEGWVESMDTTEVGLTLVQLGGGRTDPDAAIDFTVGFTAFTQLGDRVSAAEPICILHAASQADWDAAAARLIAAVRVSAEPTAAAGPIVRERLTGTPASAGTPEGEDR